MKYNSSAVRIVMVGLLFSDCCGCSQELCRDSSRLRRSTLSSMTCNLLSTSHTTCSCSSFVALSCCHFCQSPVFGDFWSLRWNWSCASASRSPPLPSNWPELIYRSVDRRLPPVALPLQRCDGCPSHLNSFCCEWNTNSFDKYNSPIVCVFWIKTMWLFAKLLRILSMCNNKVSQMKNLMGKVSLWTLSHNL